MKQVLAAGAALAVLIAAAPSFAACPADIDRVRDELRTDKGFQSRYTAGEIDSLAYRQLFDAARTFSDSGLEERCQAVLSGIREIAAKTEARTQGTDRDRTDRERTADRTAPAAPRTDDRAMMLKNAKAFSATTISAETLINADVRNMSDEDLGDVNDIVMAEGKINSVIIGRGGFLGMGVSYYQVSLDKLKIAVPTDANGRVRASGRIVVLDMTEEQMTALPKVEKDDGVWIAAGDDRNASPPATAPGAPKSRPDRDGKNR